MNNVRVSNETPEQEEERRQVEPDMRHILLVQIHNLIDLAERYSRLMHKRGDADERDRIDGEIAHVRKAVEPFNYNGPTTATAWQPIGTAPKGRHHHILLAYAADEIHLGGFVSQGYWLEMDEDAPDNMGHDGGFVDVHFDFFKCARSFGNPAYQSKGLQPTHWMPLPAAPAAA